MTDWLDAIDELNNEQDELKGIDFSRLKVGTKVIVDTRYSKYEFTILEDMKVKVKGGKYLPEEEEGIMNGSTWGGSSIKLNWVGYDMKMEIITYPRRFMITTSRVQSAIVYGDGWEYKMDWPNRID